MTKGILLDCDEHVATWAYTTYNRFPVKADRAIGIVEDGKLIGAVIFSSYNSMNAELSYYGKNTATVGIIRAIARIALTDLRLARCTVIVPKRPSYLLRKLTRFGFRYEGVQRRYYGPTDASKFMGCRFVLFREDIEKLASVRYKKAM